MIVSIEGNISSGKSTLLDSIAKASNFTCIPEPLSLWQNYGSTNPLSIYYKDPSRWCFYFQSLVQYSVVKELCSYPPNRLLVTERSLDSVTNIFNKLSVSRNYLQTHELTLLDDWSTFVASKFDIRPKCYIYLQTPPEVCFQRLISRNRPEELQLRLSDLSALSTLHDNWLLKSSNVLVIRDNSPQDVEKCVKFIRLIVRCHQNGSCSPYK